MESEGELGQIGAQTNQTQKKEGKSFCDKLTLNLPSPLTPS